MLQVLCRQNLIKKKYESNYFGQLFSSDLITIHNHYYILYYTNRRSKQKKNCHTNNIKIEKYELKKSCYQKSYMLLLR